MTTLAYIGLGSNLADPVQQIYTARQAIQALINVQEQDFSNLYRSPAMSLDDHAHQPDYINAVMAIHTTLAPLTLLASLQHIENQQGRVGSLADCLAQCPLNGLTHVS